MENWGKWKLIKTGFWLGIGFVIPALVLFYGGSIVTMFAFQNMMESSYQLTESDVSISSGFNGMTDHDVTEDIKIEHYHAKKNGAQLLILGSLVNQGASNVTSIELEAELFDANGQMVYECSEYISEKLLPNEQENFQIKCGCGKNSVPEYAQVVLTVSRANNY